MEIVIFLCDKLFSLIWKNIIFLRCCFILFVLFLLFVIKNKKILAKTFFPTTYEDLCLEIGLLLDKNKNLWREFGPNSFPDSTKDPIKQDLKLWESIKIKEIIPNNKKIRSLIDENEKVILSKDKFLFEKLINHIIAFESHVFDNTIDYRNNQFPKNFEKLIYKKCTILNKKYINKISKWLKNKLCNKKYRHLKIKSLWLFGSILKGKYESINDVDLLLFADIIKDNEIIEFSSFIKEIKLEFFKKFKKELNCVSFTKNEQVGLYEFLKKIDVKKEL